MAFCLASLQGFKCVPCLGVGDWPQNTPADTLAGTAACMERRQAPQVGRLSLDSDKFANIQAGSPPLPPGSSRRRTSTSDTIPAKQLRSAASNLSRGGTGASRRCSVTLVPACSQSKVLTVQLVS